MREGYSPFTHRTFVSRPSGVCQTSTIRMLASLQRYRAATFVAPGSNRRTIAGSSSVAHAGGLGPSLGRPSWRLCSRSRTDCRLKGLRSARSQSSSQDRRCTITTASSWSPTFLVFFCRPSASNLVRLTGRLHGAIEADNDQAPETVRIEKGCDGQNRFQTGFQLLRKDRARSDRHPGCVR